MNAIVLAHGLTAGGADGARAALHNFWRAIAERVPPLWHTAGDPPQLAAAGHALLAWSRWLAPSQLNPLNLNPLRDVLAAQIDFERLRSTPGMALFISATEVARGRLRLIRRAEVTLDAVLASACLPSLAHPVLIDGVAHWDGAFCANPALWPLVREVAADDLVLVTLSPLGECAQPTSAEAIAERVREIAFTAAFLREARWLAELHADALRQPWPRFGADRRLARLRWHLLDADDTLAQLPGNNPPGARLGLPRTTARCRPGARGALARRQSVNARRALRHRPSARLRRVTSAGQAPSSSENSVIGLVSV